MTAHSIVIIGAGAAGIAAARWLAQRGERPLVLEARDRLGGRAFTDTVSLEMPVDLGAAWLHFADENPWTQYAREHGFDVIERSPDWQRRVGRDIVPEEKRRRWQADLARYEQIIARSSAAGLDLAMDKLVPDDDYRPVFESVMRWLMGADIEQVSTLDYARYSENDNNWSVSEGLGAVIAHAGRELNVQLATPVENIDWRGPRIEIATPRGTVQASALIVTIPTTVLASGTPSFTPSLPVPILEALHGVPLGLADKVFFQLEPGALPFEGTTHFLGTDKSSRTASYATRPAGQEVLLAYFGGSFAHELEHAGKLVEFAREELRGIFGGDFIGKIRRTLTTAWSLDPWAQGSYSAARPGCARRRESLNEPIGGRIFLAGEACSIHHFGTIYGAWRSGVKAAELALGTINSA